MFQLVKINNKSTVEPMNLLSTDVANIEKILQDLAFIVSVRVKSIIIMYILVSRAGTVVLSGLSVCLLFMVSLALLSSLLSKYR
jgi:hypothetical protein